MSVFQHLSFDGPLFLDLIVYRSLVSTLQYLTITCPNIAHAINSFSQFLHSLTEDHFLTVKRILCYVQGTLHCGLTFRPPTALVALVAYFDANWIGCPDTHCSTSSYSIYLGNNLYSRCAKEQPIISGSIYEFEYLAVALTTIEILWLMHLLHGLKIFFPQWPLLLYNNKNVIFLSSNTSLTRDQIC